MYAAVIPLALVAISFASIQAAPLDADKPLIRTKRAEQVLFGNLQNHDQRVKKSNMPVASDDGLIDKKAEVQVEKVSQKEVIPEVINNGELSTSEVDAPPKEEATEDKTEDEEKENEEKIQLPNGEVDKVTDTKVQHSKDGEVKEIQTTQILESADADQESPAGSSGEDDDDNLALAKKWNDVDLDDYYYYDDSYYPYPGLYRRKRSSEAIEQRPPSKKLTADAGEERSKRSPAPKMMTAENMMRMKQSDPSSRVKRDLTTDNIRNWLENGGRFNDYPEYEDDYEGADDNERIRELLAQYSLPYGGPEDELDYPLETEQEAEQEREIEETKDRLALLKYLMEDVPSGEEGPLGYGDEIGYPDMSLRDLIPEEEEEEDDITYEPIVYNGVAGIFIPLERDPQPRKRQYMSMVPGLRKRSFYPYSVEPEGGKWGAFVPQEDKRTAESYDRLYQMARALTRDQDDLVDWEK